MADDDRPVGPVIVRRRLGNELRRLREDANLRLDAVAAELEVSPSKISRIETGHSTAKIWDVRNLLELYGVIDERRRNEVLRWAASAKTQGWWQDDLPESRYEIDYYISLEAEARTVQGYCTSALHTLLQTEDYGRTLLRSVQPELDEAGVERLVAVHAGRRRSVLGQPHPFQFAVVVDEAVLHQRVGSPDVMDGEFRHLLELPTSVDLRVRRLSTGPHSATLSPFTIFSPRVPDLDPVVVAVEAAMTDAYQERPEDIGRYQEAFHELRASALDPEASRELIAAMITSKGP